MKKGTVVVFRYLFGDEKLPSNMVIAIILYYKVP